MGKPFKRTRLWVDPAFQWRLLLRQVLYWAVMLVLWVHIAYACELTAWVLEGSGDGGPAYTDFLWRYRFMLLGPLLTLPAILYDLLKFSHRIAGPLFRCRRVMLDMADGKPVEEFRARKHDFLREHWQALNALIRAWNARTQAEPQEALRGAGPTAMPLAHVRNGAPEPQEVNP